MDIWTSSTFDSIPLLERTDITTIIETAIGMSVGEIEVMESGIRDGIGMRNTEAKHPNNPKLLRINVQRM